MARASRREKNDNGPAVMLGAADADIIQFVKAHGLGNDFVIVDAREVPVKVNKAFIQDIADRRKGIGCDQVVIMGAARHKDADVFIRFYNPDGSEAGACGNATRCVAWMVMEEQESEHCAIETTAGILKSERAGDCIVTVNMGKPRLEWQDIPLSEKCDTLFLPVNEGSSPAMDDAVAVNMGNPHAVFFVKDIITINLATIGPELERAPMFPEKANISVAEIISTQRIRMRTWERGAGLTPACGSAACAVLVAAVRRGLAAREAEIELPGGTLTIRWDSAEREKMDEDERDGAALPPTEDGDVWMTGPVHFSFTGQYRSSLLEES